jgi:PHD/YefM family antitoxin component YafN of YafNO toxin-antitoxin module
MAQREIFKIVDAGTNVSANLAENEGTEDHIVIMKGGGHTDIIVLSVSDFRRMAAALEHQY